MQEFIRDSLWVGAGGALGAFARHSLSHLFGVHTSGLPLGTLCANVAGCVLIGFFARYHTLHGSLPGWVGLLLMSGFVGSLTTFSTLMLEVEGLRLRQGFPPAAYLALTLVLGYGALIVGDRVAFTVAPAQQSGQEGVS